jgi:tRNA G18 (ribose-2'-O)-methylase SpoU
VRLERVDDPQDPRVEAYRAVRDPQWLKRRGSFLAEGRAVVRLLLAEPRFRVCSVLVTEAAEPALREDLGAADLCVFVVSPAVLRATSGVRFHQGCVAHARVPPDPPRASLIARCVELERPLVLLERLSDPDNVGSVFRNARAFAAGAVVLSPGCASPLYRKALRTSLGAALQVPFATDPDWPALLAALERAGFARFGFAPASPGVALGEYGRSRAIPPRLALLFGSEGAGLGQAALAACDARVRIPMQNGVDSLNVATASGIALHHFFTRGEPQCA